MRTTLTLDDAAFERARHYAQARSIKLGEAVSELIVLAGAQRLPLKQVDGVWVFELPPDTPAVSAARVRELLDEAP
jgi:hypothetical protein